jgi:hypothetical protein
VKFHTSCSQPLLVGNQFGSLKLVDFTGENEPIEGAFCADGAKPKALTMEYTGEAIGTHSQDASKVTVEGAPSFATPVFIVANDNDDANSGKIWFSGIVELGGQFDIDATNAGESKLTNETRVHIFASEGGALLQFVKFHTSCSQPLNQDDQFGSLKLVAFTPEVSPAPDIRLLELHSTPRPLPRETRLLANYPNPFNPETWIPFELAEAAKVTIEIYDLTGRLVRTFDLGYRSAGYYVERSAAAYWDGRNFLGERVASGSYFYRLLAGGDSAVRRMAIIK